MAPEVSSPEQVQIGSIEKIYGSVTAQSETDTRHLVAGDPVYEGEILSTGPESAVEVKFADGTVLSQSQDSTVTLDTYVYDPTTDTGDVLFKLTEGTFRMATGAIVDQNPDKFKVQSPLATIGIRGTHTGHFVPSDGGAENHGCLEYDGKPVVIQSNLGGPPQTLFSSGMNVGASPSGLGSPQPYTPQQEQFFATMSQAGMAAGPPSFDPPAFSGSSDNEQDDAQDDVREEPAADGAGGEGGEGEETDDGSPADGTADVAEGEAPPAGTGLAPGMPTIVPTLGPPGLPGTGPGSIQGTLADGPEPQIQGVQAPFPQFGLPTPEPTPPPEDPYIPEEFGDRTVVAAPEPETTTSPAEQETVTASSSEEPAAPSAPTSGDLKYGGKWSGSDIDYSGYIGGPHGVYVDLHASPQYASYYDFGSDTEHFSETFTNIKGSPFPDEFIGNSGANSMSGEAGDDTLSGKAGNDYLDGGDGADTLYGGSNGGAVGTGDDVLKGGTGADTLYGQDGTDHLYGGPENDSLYGGDGNDLLQGGPGGDSLDGGAAQDIVDYSNAGSKVELNLDTGGTAGDAAGDTFTDVEDVLGSDYDDTIVGSAGNNILIGGKGADKLDGGAGTNDTAGYNFSQTGVTIDMTLGSQVGGEAEGDTYTNIEGVVGSKHADTLTGDANNNGLYGLGGADTINGGAGSDTIQGGKGADVLNSTADTMMDTFFYEAAADSNKTGGNEDIINGFEAGYDKIDVSGLNLNVINFHSQAGTFLTSDTAGIFSSNSAGIVAYTDGGWSEIYVDADNSGSYEVDSDLALLVDSTSLGAGNIVI